MLRPYSFPRFTRRATLILGLAVTEFAFAAVPDATGEPILLSQEGALYRLEDQTD